MLLLLSLCVLCGCFGSGNRYDDEAIAKYQEVVQATNAMSATAYEADISIYKEVERKQRIGKLNFKGQMRFTDADVELSMDMKLSFSGISLDNIHLYYKDQTMYMDMMDTKIKESVPSEGQSMASLLEQSRRQLSEDEIKEMFTSITFADETKHVICAELNPDIILDRMNQADYGEDFSFERMEMLLSEENGTWKKLTLRMDARAEGEAVAVDIDFRFSDTNAIDHIDFPDFSEYIDNASADVTENDKYGDMETKL